MTKDEFLEELFSTPDAQARRILIDENSEFLQLNTIHALKERADRMERDDAHQALALGLVAEEMAELLSNNEARALAQWIQANAHDFLAELESAVDCYERASTLFKTDGKILEAARTSIGQMFTLMKMGQFEQAQTLAELARVVFAEYRDMLSLAKIDMNLGNIHYQQGQYVQALSDYKQATEAFQSQGETLYGAMNQINQATALTMLDDFLKAEQLHEQAKPIFEAAGLRTVAASVDHDLAVIQYARGNYADAFRTFERSRATFSSLSTQVNLAITDLEESDLYLDLNLPEEAYRLAEQAEQAFTEMGMIFELARASVNHAVAIARLGQNARAITILEGARSQFVSQGNDAWVAHTDLQRAEIVGLDGQREPARLLAEKAAQAYKNLGLKTKQAYAHIVSANLWADDMQWERTLQELQAARKILSDLAAPWLEQRIDTCMGRVSEGMGETAQAIEHYKKAANRIEQMATALTAEEHRTAFVSNKLAPYEALVTLYGSDNPSLAFLWAEQAKSRALVDLLASGIRPRLHINDEMDASQANRLQTLREELNWLYTRLTRGAAPGESGAPAAGPEVWAKIEEREREATSLWRALQARHAEELSLIRGAPLTPTDVQTVLPDGAALVEYFVARGQVTAFVITKNEVYSFPAIAALSDLLPLMEDLTFQFSKFQYGSAYYYRHYATLLSGTQEILEQLGQKLIVPLWKEISAFDAIIIVPHGPLHALPFQALRVNDRYLIETHAISYAPSATVLKFCWNKHPGTKKQPPFSGKPLLIGIPDEYAYHITEEIQALAKLFEDADVLLGDQATFNQINTFAPASSVIHLAAHGLFRPEAPLLSSIRLADRWLAVQDIYNLDLRAELVTLSACETGLGHDAGGDDLVGLVRGFLHAGAASLIVSLWTVDDESMTHLITDFYTHWLAGSPKAQALRQAQLALIKKYEHPYYWAPLVLVGNEK
jgi:tetratricopeptide (TPR) repeat protein